MTEHYGPPRVQFQLGFRGEKPIPRPPEPREPNFDRGASNWRDFQKRNQAAYRKLLNRIAAEAFDDVIPRFHIVRGTAIDPKIFTFIGKVGAAGSTIELTKGGRQFLIDYGKLVDYVAVSGWVRFTEEFTSAPKLHDKIGGTNARRRTVSQWRESLLQIQSGKCFYDDKHEMSSPEVDHVQPWSFVLEDKAWNLVLTCRGCNSDKRDRLADEASLERLCARNERIIKGDIAADPSFCRHFADYATPNCSPDRFKDF